MNPGAQIKRWLFRWVPDEPAPIVLGQRRIFIVPARAGTSTRDSQRPLASQSAAVPR